MGTRMTEMGPIVMTFSDTAETTLNSFSGETSTCRPGSSSSGFPARERASDERSLLRWKICVPPIPLFMVKPIVCSKNTRRDGVGQFLRMRACRPAYAPSACDASQCNHAACARAPLTLPLHDDDHLGEHVCAAQRGASARSKRTPPLLLTARARHAADGRQAASPAIVGHRLADGQPVLEVLRGGGVGRRRCVRGASRLRTIDVRLAERQLARRRLEALHYARRRCAEGAARSAMERGQAASRRTGAHVDRVAQPRHSAGCGRHACFGTPVSAGRGCVRTHACMQQALCA